MFVARGKLMLFADADGASQFSEYNKLEIEMKRLKKNSDNLAIVCGSRAHLEKDSIAPEILLKVALNTINQTNLKKSIRQNGRVIVRLNTFYVPVL
jgi:hypothetical protein